MDIKQALQELNVTENTLTLEQKQFLDQNGYLILPNILSPSRIAAIVERLQQLEAIEGDDAGKEVHQEAGTIRLSDLVNKDPMFEICFTQPQVLAGIAHVLENDLKLSSLNSRAALPGHGLQALHMDLGQNAKRRPAISEGSDGQYVVCNSIWLLSDFTSHNGPTRLVPGSQLRGQNPREVLADPMAPHPDEIYLTAPAGTVVVFNSHTWHGGTLNTSDSPRRALHSYFCRRDLPQQLDQRQYIRGETYERLSQAARCILDV